MTGCEKFDHILRHLHWLNSHMLKDKIDNIVISLQIKEQHGRAVLKYLKD